MRRRERAGIAALALATGVAVFAIGGAPRWAVVAVTLIGAGAAALQVTSQRRIAAISPVLLLLAIAIALTAAQLVPLPIAALEALNPTAAGLVLDGARVRGEAAPTWAPLSVDPASTGLELVELIALFAIAFVASRIATSGRGRERLLAIVALVAGAAALVALAHRLAGAERLYGLYEPTHARGPMRAPLLNLNHFASLMVIGVLLGAGFAADGRRGAQARLGFGGLALVCLAALMSTSSRGGVVALAIGLSVALALLGVQHRARLRPALRRSSTWAITIPAAVLIACGMVLVVYLSSSGVLGQLAGTTARELDEPNSKFVAWRSAGHLIHESPWVGIGRGGFESAFTRVHPASARFTYSHVENEYLQAVVDWGIPGALALLGALAWIVIAALGQWNGGPLAAAALGALAAIAAQSMVDFGVELLGLAVPVVVLMAALVPAALRELEPGRRRAIRIGRGALVGAVVAAAAIAASPAGRTLRDDRARLDAGTDLATARAAMARHPLDYLSAGRAAAAALRDRQPDAPDLLNHALRLHPTHPDLHRLAARLLVSSGRRAQALVEYRLAIAGTAEPLPLLRELLALVPDAAEAARGIPPDYPKPKRLAQLLIGLERPDVAIRYLVAALEFDRKNRLKLELLADLATRQGDLPAAELALRRLAEIEPSVESELALARVLVAAGRGDDAIATLDRAVVRDGASRTIAEARLLLADVHAAREAWAAARAALQPLEQSAGLDPKARRGLHRRLATIEEQLGNARQADWQRARARELEQEP